MYRYNDLRIDLDINHEVEFGFKEYECFITPTNLGWELWVDNKLVYRESVLDVFLMTPCLDGQSIFEIFDKVLYTEQTLCIF